MEEDKIKKLIINSGYTEPTKYHQYDRETRKFIIKE